MARVSSHILVVLFLLAQVSYQQFTLNGKTTDVCPFYTTLNSKTNVCEPEDWNSEETYNVLSEFWYQKNLALTDLDPRWKLGNVDSGTVITTCSGLQIYGGHNALKSSNKKTRSITASYSNLAPHKEIQLNFKFYFVDSWDSESLIVKIDGITIDNYKHDVDLSPANICGSGYKDFVKTFHYEIAHSADTLSISIEWVLDQNSDDESGGLREIQVLSTAKTLYFLNGKFTDRCPFYAPLDAATKTCVDPSFAKTQTQQFELLDESLYYKQFDFSSFKSSNWVAGNSASSESDYISICGPLSIYGGYNKIQNHNGKLKTISATFYNLDPHTEVHIRFQFWFLDSWDNERMRIRVNGDVQKEVQHKLNAAGSKQICGNPNYNEFVANYELKVPHTIDYLEVIIEWDLDENSANESGGVRELQILSLLQPKTYTLNGKKTDRCPWYTKADEKSLVCVDELVNSYKVPYILDEFFYRKDFSYYDMEKGSKFKKTFSNSQENYISSCQGLSLFGGYKVTQKSGDSYKGIFVNYQNLEPHEEITVRFNFYMIDTWDSKDTLQIYVDNVLQRSFTKNNKNPKTFLCGISGENDFADTYTITFNHTARNLELNIRWVLDEGTDNESGGIRDVQVVAKGIPPIDLNGKNTDICPFYTTFDQVSRICVDGYVNALGNPIILSETLYKRQFSEQELFAQSWQPLALDKKNNYISECGDFELYGGYGALSNTGVQRKSIKATYSNLKPHHQISLKFKFFFVDSWDNEPLSVTIDGVERGLVRSTHSQNTVKTSVCGNSGFSDKNMIQVYTINHTSSTLSIEIAWNLNSDTEDESGGLRDLQVVAAGCAQPRCISCRSETECLEYLPEPVVPKPAVETASQQTQGSSTASGASSTSSNSANNVPTVTVGGDTSSSSASTSNEPVATTGGDASSTSTSTDAEAATEGDASSGSTSTDAEAATEGDASSGSTSTDAEVATEGDAQSNSETLSGDATSQESTTGPVTTQDNLPTDPAQFDLSYYQDNQEPFVDPLQPNSGENIPPVTQDTETTVVPADIGFEEELVAEDPNAIDLQKLAEEQQQQEIATQECVILYSECYYQGEEQKFCDDSPFMIKTVKSIYIPSDVKRVQLFEDVDFQGKKSEYTESQECLEEINYQFLINSRLKIQKRNSNHRQFLRKNKFN